MIRFGRNPKDHLVQPLSHEQGWHSLDQIAQGPLQLGLEYFQEWDICNLSGKPVSVCHHLYSGISS